MSSLSHLVESAQTLGQKMAEMVTQTEALQLSAMQAAERMMQQTEAGGTSPFVMGLTVFVLAVFVGYYVVWKVTPALHSPLMAVTNAISSVIIVGALLAAGLDGFGFAKVMGFCAVFLASVNICGGFLVTQRMLAMFSSKKKTAKE